MILAAPPMGRAPGVDPFSAPALLSRLEGNEGTATWIKEEYSKAMAVDNDQIVPACAKMLSVAKHADAIRIHDRAVAYLEEQKKQPGDEQSAVDD
jgi:hypothetical protein